MYYNTALVIDANVLTEPRVWHITKVNRNSSKGIAVFTAAQDVADQHTLKADYDDSGNVVAWWADWNESNIQPSPAVVPDPIDTSIVAKILCSGKPQFKVGGSAKTFTVKYYGEIGEVPHDPGTWQFSIDGQSVGRELLELTNVDESKIKVKFLGDDSYIGKILLIENTADDAIASLQVEIIAL